MNTECYHYSSPIGIIEITATESNILKLQFVEKGTIFSTENILLQLCHNQLNNYFNAINSKFDVPLKFQGTLFQQLVWNEILNIPYGQTISYSQLAQAIRKPQAVRAVAQACKSNSFAVIVPCHRIIAANGSLGGYNAGTERKAWLLNHEKYQLNTINF